MYSILNPLGSSHSLVKVVDNASALLVADICNICEQASLYTVKMEKSSTSLVRLVQQMPSVYETTFSLTRCRPLFWL